jgi:2-methylcitrate dehydratase PrpD
MAEQLVDWINGFTPTRQDLDIADRGLLDTVAVTLAGRHHRVATSTREESEALRWGTVGHVLDFDDVHLASTSHVSAVCVPAALSSGGGSHAYLSAAGAMARLGVHLGWPHYQRGWHVTCTAGVTGAAVAAGVSMGLNRKQLLAAIALAVPASGGVQRAFGTDAKAIQVGFAVEAGVRAARLAARGVTADPRSLDDMLRLMGAVGDSGGLSMRPAVPGGLAIKIYPACYALQRPIHCLSTLVRETGVRAEDIERITIRTPQATVAPLIHHQPSTGLEAKFSLEYAAATATLDGYSGFAAFGDKAVQRPEAQELLRRVEVQVDPGGNGLLDGAVHVGVHTRGGELLRASESYPPGSPQRPATQAELAVKVADCLVGTGVVPTDISWDSAAQVVRSVLG